MPSLHPWFIIAFVFENTVREGFRLYMALQSSLGLLTERLAGYAGFNRSHLSVSRGQAAGRGRIMASAEDGTAATARPPQEDATAEQQLKVTPPSPAKNPLPRVDSIPVVTRQDGTGAGPLLPFLRSM